MRHADDYNMADGRPFFTRVLYYYEPTRIRVFSDELFIFCRTFVCVLYAKSMTVTKVGFPQKYNVQCAPTNE